MPRLLYVLPAFLIIVASLIIFTHSTQVIPSQRDNTLTPTPIVTQSDQWQTYTNSHLSFKYPSEWMVRPTQTYGSGSETAFSYNYGYPLYLRTSINYNQATGKAFASLDEFLGQRAANAQDISINHHPAKYIEDPGGDHVTPYKEVVMFNLDKSLIISLYFQPSYSQTNVVFSLLLPTFKFLDQGTFQICGGPVLTPCPAGYTCQLTTIKSGNLEETSGSCVKI